MIEKILAGIALFVCVALLGRLLLSTHRQLQFDFAVERAWASLRRTTLRLVRWPSARRQAHRETRDAIERARGGEWDGNVYRPKSFRRPKKPH